MVSQSLSYGEYFDRHDVYPKSDLSGKFLGDGFSLCDQTGSFLLERVVFEFVSSVDAVAGNVCGQTKHFCVRVSVQHQAHRRTDVQRWRVRCGRSVSGFRPDRVAFSGVLSVTVGMLSFGKFHIALGFVRWDFGDCGLVGPHNWFVCKNPSRLGDPCASGELGTSVVLKGVAFELVSIVGAVAVKREVGSVLVMAGCAPQFCGCPGESHDAKFCFTDNTAKHQTKRNPVNAVFEAKWLIDRKFADPILRPDRIGRFETVDRQGASDCGEQAGDPGLFMR